MHSYIQAYTHGHRLEPLVWTDKVPVATVADVKRGVARYTGAE